MAYSLIWEGLVMPKKSAENNLSRSAVSPIRNSFSKKAIGKKPHLDRLDRLCYRITTMEGDTEILDKILNIHNICYDISKRDLDRIPQQGPVIVMANHPFGAIDSIIQAAVLRKVRPDIKVIANYTLSRIKEIADMFIPVAPFEPGSDAVNFSPMKEALEWLQGGHLLALFPAGEASYIKWKKWKGAEPPWSEVLARLIRESHASVVPALFSGSTNFLFQVAGLIPNRLKTIMLPREMLEKVNKTVEVQFGKVISHSKCAKFDNDPDMVKYLRWRTYLLGHLQGEPPRVELTPPQPETRHHLEPVVAPLDPGTIEREILALPSDQRLLESEKYEVYFAHARQIPTTLREIGRLREFTFRLIGEGTGHAIDLDHFDDYYLHLFVWNVENKDIVGSYRIGRTDLIRKERGIMGLYTHTLFRYRSKFIDQIGPALELGRSFVRSEYQKTFHPLMLLWKGIGQFVIKHPGYKTLFGPVSITSDYESISRYLIAAFFNDYEDRPDMARLVRPRNPLKKTPLKGLKFDAPLALLQNVQDLSELVSDIEKDNKGIPILLKQYLKLGGQTLGFNVDSNFSNALDALIVVDLTQTNRKILERYMGKKEAAFFLSHHRDTLPDGGATN